MVGLSGQHQGASPSPGMQHPSTCATTARNAQQQPASHIITSQLRDLSLHHARLLSNINALTKYPSTGGSYHEGVISRGKQQHSSTPSTPHPPPQTPNSTINPQTPSPSNKPSPLTPNQPPASTSASASPPHRMNEMGGGRELSPASTAPSGTPMQPPSQATLQNKQAAAEHGKSPP
ncbi:hypothetical protein F5144DRAFT_345604 [Chaetomium tenue]|uniref:Uncharacterized protein n=1 Tax=Chaetomium tenue TaxID=1854479 RepID=A0ACB7NZB2_9PEZI|nr:hypothetical protein F5144DRAFT_345604 [Chaetomium globosum]